MFLLLLTDLDKEEYLLTGSKTDELFTYNEYFNMRQGYLPGVARERLNFNQFFNINLPVRFNDQKIRTL